MKKRLALLALPLAAAVLAAPAQAYPCEKDIHIETGLGVHICINRPWPL